MTTLLQDPTPVHSADLRIVRFHVEEPPDDLWLYDHDEPFHPSPEDLAYDTGYVVGSEDGRYRMPSSWKNDGRGLRFAMGRQAGQKAREVKDAYDLGHAMGVETEQSEPPAGLAAHEAKAYREGFADAQAEYEAYLEERAREREMEAFGDPNDAIHQGERLGVC